MAFSGPAEDQQAIRALNETYADAVFRRDAEAWGATWTEDARWNLMGTEATGRAAIVALWQGAMAGFPFASFFVQPGSLRVDGDTAEGIVYTHEVLEAADGSLLRPVGRYTDSYAKTAEGWRFAARTYEMLKG